MDDDGERVGEASFTPDEWKLREPVYRSLARATDYVEWRRSPSGLPIARRRPMPLPGRSRFYTAESGATDHLDVVVEDGGVHRLRDEAIASVALSRPSLAELGPGTVIVMLNSGTGPAERPVGRRLADATGLTVIQPRWGSAPTPGDHSGFVDLHLLEAPDGSPGGWFIHHLDGTTEEYDPAAAVSGASGKRERTRRRTGPSLFYPPLEFVNGVPPGLRA